MTEQSTEEDSEVSDEVFSQRSDAKLFCLRCWRIEYHFSAYRAQSRASYLFWCFATLGLLYLIGPYRCRCCGERRFWRFDLLNEHQARARGAKKRSKRKARSNYEPFRTPFSLGRLIRKGFRGLRNLIPGSRKNRDRRRRR